MTKETAQKAAALLLKIDSADKVLTFLDRQDVAWFGLKHGEEYWPMPAESITGARRCYQKLKEHAEAELEKL
jgi:hypothetical protein